MQLPWNLLFTGEWHLSNAICVCARVGAGEINRGRLERAGRRSASCTAVTGTSSARSIEALRETGDVSARLVHQQVARTRTRESEMKRLSF